MGSSGALIRDLTTREPVRLSASSLVPTVVPRLRSVVGHFGPTRGASLAVWTIAGRRLAALPGWRCGVNVQAADITGFGRQVGGYVRAFYRRGNNADDVVVGYAFRVCRAGTSASASLAGCPRYEILFLPSP
jgi:hypothetical protein